MILGTNMGWFVALLIAVAGVFVALQVLTRQRLRQIQGREIPESWRRGWPDPVLLFITSPGCRACEAERQKLPEIKKVMPIREVSVPEYPALVQHLQVFATPTWVLLENGVVKQAWVGRFPLRILRYGNEILSSMEATDER